MKKLSIKSNCPIIKSTFSLFHLRVILFWVSIGWSSLVIMCFMLLLSWACLLLFMLLITDSLGYR